MLWHFWMIHVKGHGREGRGVILGLKSEEKQSTATISSWGFCGYYRL